SNSTNNFTLIGTIIEPNVISFSIPSSLGIDYGNYNVYVKDLKTNDYYGPLNITLREKYQIPPYAIDVTDEIFDINYVVNIVINVTNNVTVNTTVNGDPTKNPSNILGYNEYVNNGITTGLCYNINIIDGNCNHLDILNENLTLNCTMEINVMCAVPNDNISDNAAFINALKNISNSGGGTLFVPAGRYIIDDSQFGHSTIGVVLPDEYAHSKGNYHIVGEGTENTIIDFNFSSTPKASSRLFVLTENSSISNLTLKVSCNKLSSDNNDQILQIKGSNSVAKGIIIDADSSRLDDIIPVSLGGSYNTIEDIKIYSEGQIDFAGRQNSINRVIHYGMREIGYYNYTPPSTSGWTVSRGIGGPAYSTRGGVQEIILENSKAISRWGKSAEPDWKGVYRGHVKRFYTSSSVEGPIHHVYYGNNYGSVFGCPWTDAENFLIEMSCRQSNFYYNTTDGLDINDETILKLSQPIFIPKRAHLYQSRAPLTIAIVEGKGFGQIRNGYVLDDNQSVKIDKKFIVAPDSTSIILIQPTGSELIIYNNHFTAKHTYSVGNPAIYFNGRVANNIVRENTLDKHYIGLARSIYYCSWVSVANYFQEYIDNTVNNSILSLVTMVESTGDATSSLGAVYRNNIFINSNIERPYRTEREPFSAMGISTSRNLNAAPGTIDIATIYEKNIVNYALRGFYTERNFADWLVLRNNSYSNISQQAIEIVDPVEDIYIGESIVNTLPYIDIVDATSGVDYRCVMKEGPLQTSCYVWSKYSSASVNISITDYENDSITSVSASGNSDIVPSGDQYILSWNLSEGFHEIKIFASDGKENRIKTFYLFVGEYDPFDIVSFSNCTSGCGYEIQTPISNYTTNTTIIFNDSHYHNVNIANSGNPIYSGLLRIRPIREEVILREEANNSLKQNAIISFVKDIGMSYGSYIRIRLLQDENNYYEFYDDVGITDDRYYSPYLKQREIIKVVNGDKENPALRVEEIAAHNFMTPMIFEKKGNVVRAMLIDGYLELNDTDPLYISNWEILVANRPDIGDTFKETYSGIDFDNLYFHKWDDIQLSPQVETQDNLISFILKLFGKAVLELKDITGKVIDFVWKK
ncbi:MAG: hypothetical protein ACFFG0_32260, partial [Candidatus Thorarchaeota archaeon]